MTGTSTAVAGLECNNHAGVNAAVVCSVCGKPVCEDCCVRIDQGSVCEDDSHRMIAQHWNLLYRVDSEFEADMIAANLKGHSIPTQVFSSRIFKLTIGDNTTDGVNIFVGGPDYRRALDLLAALELTATLTNTQSLN